MIPFEKGRHCRMGLNRWIVVGATLAIQLLLLGAAFPIDGISKGLGPFHIDHPYHQYQVDFGRQLLKHWQMNGYDPMFGGGSLGGMAVNASARMPVLLAALVPDSVSTQALYSTYLLACGLVSTLAIASIGLLLRLPTANCIALSLAGIVFWWVGAFHWYHTAGMAAFVTAAFTGVSFAVIAFNSMALQQAPNAGLKVILAGVAGGLGLWLHPLFAVVATITVVALIITHWRGLNISNLSLQVLGVALIALALNLPWLLAMRHTQESLLDQPYQKTVGLTYLGRALIGRWDGAMGSLSNPLSVAALALGLCLRPKLNGRLVAALSLAGASFAALAAFGAISPALGMMQPNRFMPVAFMLIGLAAALVWSELAGKASTGTHRSLQWVAGISLLSVLAVLGREVVREARPGPHGHYGSSPELTAPPEDMQWLVDTINAKTTKSARIIFENSLGRVYGGGHAAGYIALKTGREFVGGAYPFQLPIKSFWDGRALGSAVDAVSDEKLSEVIELFNVGWIITHTTALADRVQSLPGVKQIDQRKGVRVFAIERLYSYLAAGDGVVAARSADKVSVISRSATPIILRYQWIEGLTAGPGRTIEPHSLSPYYPPFIRIIGPAGKFDVGMAR